MYVLFYQLFLGVLFHEGFEIMLFALLPESQPCFCFYALLPKLDAKFHLKDFASLHFLLQTLFQWSKKSATFQTMCFVF